MSDEVSINCRDPKSDASPQDDVFDMSDLTEEIQHEDEPRSVHLSGDSGIAVSCESVEPADDERRRRSNSDDSETFSSSFRDELKVYWLNKTRKLRKLADKDFLTSSVRVRSQSIAEEGEYNCDESAKEVGVGKAGGRQRRNSDQCSSSSSSSQPAAAAAAAAADAQPQQRSKRQQVKQILESLRHRSRHDTPASMADPELGAESKGRRARSPVGSIVNRLRLMGNSDPGEPDVVHRRRRHSAVQPQTLPHPKDLPLDHSFCADLRHTSQLRLRKLSHPPIQGSVQERHKDLFEQLTHSPDVEGQCSIMSAAAMAETRGRRLSGPTQSLPACSRQRAASGSEVQVTENEKYIIFKSRCQSEKSVNLQELIDDCSADVSAVFHKFAQHHSCYDVMPSSSKLLVFDTELSVRKAFFALVYNGLRAAPLWHSARSEFTGMFTVTDFIHILHQMQHNQLLAADALDLHKISTWRTQLRQRLQQLRWISPEASLLSAARVLLHARVHRLLVLQQHTGNALFIVTHKRLLNFIHLHLHLLPKPTWLHASIFHLGVGTFRDLVTVQQSASLASALSLFVSNRVSALPVLDAAGKLVNIYSRFDVINLAATKTYHNLSISVSEALQYRSEKFHSVRTCLASDSLLHVIDELVAHQVHRLVVIDDQHHVIGVVSLSDVLHAILLSYRQLEACVAEAHH